MSSPPTIDPARLLTRLQRAEAQSQTEEDLRVRIEHVLRDAIADLAEPQYEHSIRTSTYLGRADAVHTRLVIEYEPPRRMKGAMADHAVSQVCDYLTGIALGAERASAETLTREEEEKLSSMVGIATDGERYIFVQRRARGWHTEPKVLNLATTEKLLLWFRSTARKDLSAANLIRDFGPTTELASNAVRVLAELVASGDHAKAVVVYEEWRRIFGIVYGTDQLARTSQAPDTKSLRTAYNLTIQNVTFAQLLFAIHTYYALLMKMLVTELIVAQGTYADSFIGNLTRSVLREKLSQLESGEILESRKIRNAIEEDFFGWYTAAWTKDLGDILWKIADSLGEYDIATFELKPDRARDLLKDLYHGLIPETIRHSLGEYYTPDWLADHTISLSGFDGDPHRSFLDPSCGSGTFLVLAIQRVRDWLNDHSPEWNAPGKRRDALSLIQRNIVGFDLNPLAVIASRTNYLFALGPLLRHHTGGQQLEIPVYLTDSVLLPGQVGAQRDMFAKDTVSFPMTVGTFEVPREVVDRKQVSELMSMLHEAVVERHSQSVFVKKAIAALHLAADSDTSEALAGLFNAMLKLDQEGKNRIWTKLIRNHYASLFFRGHFDFVVGNPPHVNWEYLSQDWRKAAEKEYQRYGLFTLAGLESRHGGGKKDIAALFTYAVIDHFLKPTGVMALVAHVSLFKTSGAGEGFRRFRLGNKEPFRIEVAHDFSSFQPFLTRPGMKIKTRTVTFRALKGKETKYPVPYFVWKKNIRGNLPGDVMWSDAGQVLSSKEIEARPLRGTTSVSGVLSPWLTLSTAEHRIVRPVLAPDNYKAHYQAREGLNSGGLNGAYFLNVLERHPDGMLLVENRHDIGKIKVPRVQTVIEDRFVFPLIRGRGIARWRYERDGHVLVVQDPRTQRGVAEDELQANYPMTWAYLRKFEKRLKQRKAFRKFFDPDKDPFYSMYSVSEQTFMPHKVVWMDISSHMKAVVVSSKDDKLPIPEHTSMFVPVKSADEAHYLAAVLNSKPASTAIAGYIVDNHVSTHPCENIILPKFDKTSALHQSLVRLSRRAHEAQRADNLDSVATAEAEINAAVTQLW